MGVITISMKDEKEKRLREYAKEKYGERKGHLTMAITEAVDEKIEEDERGKARKKLLEIMEKGYHMGKIKIKHRSELYDR
ncbi:MAG: hypothetical protein QW331_03425 [Candidatus Woesearchaeota archaeon]